MRPTLVIQTVYLCDAEREAAVDLGNELYAHLTRPPDDPLAYGAGVPVLSGVAAKYVEPAAADIVVLVPVLGKTSFQTARQFVLDRLKAWHLELGEGHVLPVLQAEVWRNVEQEMPGKPLLTALYGGNDADRATLDEVVLAVARLLDKGSESGKTSAQLFISHAKRDLERTGDAARRIFWHVVNSRTGAAFFDATDLHAGQSLADQIEQAASRGVLVAVRSDAYSSRAWCQQELLTAKQHGLPALTVEILDEGEDRASPYVGNTPSIVWKGDAGAIVSRAMVEWLRAAYFQHEAKRVREAAELPGNTKILARPPELLDLAQGPLARGQSQLVLHPDPELSVQERRVLRNSHPRLQLATPTTVFRRLLGRDGRGGVATPLEGLQVALSLSDNPDVGGPQGYTDNHFRDATVYLVRSLVSAGAAIAYGGDFRKGGFTPLLSELIAGYNQTARKPADFLHSYLAAILNKADAPDRPMDLHSLAEGGDLAKEALVSESAGAPDPLYYSDMRRVLAQKVSACVVIGGNAEPRSKKNKNGYGGRYPGIVEESWRMLEAKKPLYVLGGFGGAAALVTELLDGNGEIPRRLRDEAFHKNKKFRKGAKAIDADPHREKLGLPRRMQDLAKHVRELGAPLLQSDESSIEWNGLTVDENRQLFYLRDPLIQASLVLKGLLKVTRARSKGKLEIELTHGSVTHANDLDAIALATFEHVPLGGAGAALDRMLGGKASMGQVEGRSLVSLNAPDIDANWLHLVSLGPLSNAAGKIDAAIEDAAREASRQAQRHGFKRIGTVTFGGSLANAEKAATAMLRGFRDLAGRATVVWFETDSKRFDTLHEMLADDNDVALSTRVLDDQPVQATESRDALLIHITYDGSRLSSTIVPPAGTGVANSIERNLESSDLDAFGCGSGAELRNAPRLETLEERGEELAKLLLGDNAAELLARSGDVGVTVIHDLRTSKLPFEMLSIGDQRPATKGGIKRRLAIPRVPMARMFALPPGSGKLRVVLVVNPTGDLVGAEAEAQAVQVVLERNPDRIQLTILGDGRETDATRETVIEALQSADVLHYCGHAFFNGPGEDQSGLVLANNELLTLRDMRELSTVPRVVFFNACEAGRVRGTFTTEAAAFAELILRSGVEAYLGTIWRVDDTAAALFARGVYVRLADGKNLDSAVTESRADLLSGGHADWANYLLYGDGRFSLPS